MSTRVTATTLFVMISFHFLSILSYRTFRRSSSSSSSRLYAAKVILEKGKARLFQDGNPLIYGGAVKQVVGDPEPGSEVMVEDHMGNVLGRGVFNPFSQYRVRMLARNHDPAFSMSFEELLFTRISQAGLLRQAVGLPSAHTTVYRLINGEGSDQLLYNPLTQPTNLYTPFYTLPHYYPPSHTLLSPYPPQKGIVWVD